MCLSGSLIERDYKDIIVIPDLRYRKEKPVKIPGRHQCCHDRTESSPGQHAGTLMPRRAEEI